MIGNIFFSKSVNINSWYYTNIKSTFPDCNYISTEQELQSGNVCIVVSSYQEYLKYSNYLCICPKEYSEDCIVMPIKDDRPVINIEYSREIYPYLIPLEKLYNITYSSYNNIDISKVLDISLTRQTGKISYMSKGKDNNFIIIVPSYNCHEYLEKCLKSIESSSYRNFKVCIIDDASDCHLHQNTCKFYSDVNNWSLIINKVNKKALYNIVNAIDIMKPNEEDIIIILDGDDYIFEKTLEILNHHYSDDTMITFGTYVYDSDNVNFPHFGLPIQFPMEKITFENIRRIPWIFSHLRSFKYKLWKFVDLNDLKNKKEYYPVSWDLALMYPMIEMGFNHLKFVEHPIYCYNVKNNNNDFKLNKELQYSFNLEIRSKNKYSIVIFK